MKRVGSDPSVFFLSPLPLPGLFSSEGRKKEKE